MNFSLAVSDLDLMQTCSEVERNVDDCLAAGVQRYAKRALIASVNDQFDGPCGRARAVFGLMPERDGEQSVTAALRGAQAGNHALHGGNLIAERESERAGEHGSAQTPRPPLSGPVRVRGARGLEI